MADSPTTTKTKPGPGGSRPGAGRKARWGQRAIPVTVQLPNAAVAALDQLVAEGTYPSRSEAVAAIVMRSLRRRGARLP